MSKRYRRVTVDFQKMRRYVAMRCDACKDTWLRGHNAKKCDLCGEPLRLADPQQQARPQGTGGRHG